MIPGQLLKEIETIGILLKELKPYPGLLCPMRLTLVGIERTILPSAAGAALVTTPAAVVVGALGNMTVDVLPGAG